MAGGEPREPRRWDADQLARRDPEPAHGWPPDNVGNASAFAQIKSEREADGGTLSAAEADLPRKPGYKHVRSAGALAPALAGAAAAGVDPGVHQQDRNLLRLLDGSATEWRRQFLVEHADPPGGAGSDRYVPTYCAIHGPRYVYVALTTGEEELYDLRTDPYQLQNLLSPAVGTMSLPPDYTPPGVTRTAVPVQLTRERRTQNSLPSGSARTTHDASP